MNKTNTQQVLHALKSIVDWNSKSLDSGEDAGRGVTSMQLNKARDAIALCEADLARVDEPVAYCVTYDGKTPYASMCIKRENADSYCAITGGTASVMPLYSAQQEAVAPGWMLVPIEPTPAMAKAGGLICHRSDDCQMDEEPYRQSGMAVLCYLDMLAAAPEPKP